MFRIAPSIGLCLALSCAIAEAADCRQQGYASATVRVSTPIAHADRMLQNSLDTAAKLTDPIKAIAQLQEHQFSMQHPEIERGNPAGYYRVRCANSKLYAGLNNAIAERVQQLLPRYRQGKRYLGSSQQQRHANSAVTAEVGLLNLLLLANLYDEFETEAVNFLRSAIGNSAAGEHFGLVYKIARMRQDHIKTYKRAYASEYAKPITYLLPVELAALTKLADLADRLEPIRDQHVQFWTEKEEESYQTVLAQPPIKNSLLQIPFELSTAITQLGLARDLAQPINRANILQHAVIRGDSLVALDRHAEAIGYYKLADAQDKLKAAQLVVETAAQKQLTQLRKRAASDIAKMKKTEAQRESFEQDTHSLADELGIDLDDF